GRRLLIFVQLVDMLELAMANPVNYSRTDAFFKLKPEQLANFQALLFAMGNRLNLIGTLLSNPKKLRKSPKIEELLQKIKFGISDYNSVPTQNLDENLLLLRNYFKYQKEQARKIEKIEWLMKNPAHREVSLIKNEDARRFLTKQNYGLELLVENFNLRSPIFKHSLRLAVMTLVGYGIGVFFSLQNPYWILLTLIVIMRPTSGLTKKRSKE